MHLALPCFSASSIRLGACCLHGETLVEHRFSRSTFFGYHREESEMLKNEGLLSHFRDKAQETLASGDASTFVRVAADTQRDFESLPPQSPLFLDPDLAFNGPLSPLNGHYQKIYRLSFNKILAVLAHEQRIVSNQSGYYFTGGRGVGKTTMLRISATTIAQLLPKNILTVYTDYASGPQPPLRPSQLVFRAMGHHPVLHDKLQQTDQNSGIDALLAVAEQHRVSVSFYADELQEAYVSDVWSEMHTLATSLKHSLFVTGSDALLPLMVCCEPSHRSYLHSRKYTVLSS